MYRKLLLACIFHAFFGTAAFLNESLLNPIELEIRQFANRTLERYGITEPSETSISILWSILNASFPFGYILSVFVIRFCADRFGRRATTMIINNCILIVASVLMWLAKEIDIFELLLVGRILAGISDQVCMLGFIFVIEASDSINSDTSAMIVRCGCIVWYIVGAAVGSPYLMGNSHIWNYGFLIPIAPALVHMVGACFLPESPKHLFITQHQEEKSIESLLFYQGPDANIEKIIGSFKAEEAEGDTNDGKTLRVKDIFAAPQHRWPFLISVAAAFACRTSGFDIENFYSTGIIAGLGVSFERAALYNILILRLPSLLFMFITLALVHRFESRPYLLSTLFGGLLSLTLLFIAQLLQQYHLSDSVSQYLGVGSLFLGISCWHLGAGYLPKFLPGHCCPQESRTFTAAVQAGVTGVSALLFSLLYPPMSELFGAYALAPVMVVGCLTVAWLVKYLPETRDKTVDEVVRRWMDDSNVGKQSGYQGPFSIKLGDDSVSEL